MDKKNFADLEYSKQLKDLFPKAEFWWMRSSSNNSWTVMHKSNLVFANNVYTALTTDMLLEKLPEWTRIHKSKEFGYFVDNNMETPAMNWTDKKLSNALAKLLLWLKKEKLL